MTTRNETRAHRQARKIQAGTNLSYQQARNLLAATSARPDFDDPTSIAAFVAAHGHASTAPPVETERNSVYVTTSGGGIDGVVIDGPVIVHQIDWANGDPVGSADEAAEAVYLQSGLPAGLIDALVSELVDAGWPVTDRPEPGPDRPWAVVTFVDETFAAQGYRCSDDVTVVYHDWSLRFADLDYGMHPAHEDLVDLRASVDTLGPNGRRQALQLIEHYESKLDR